MKLPQLTYRVWMVWRRNFDVFLKTLHLNFLPTIMEPLLYLAAFGVGLGALITGAVQGGTYLQFIAPGLISITTMYGGFFECTYASFVRMYFQKTFDAIIATPVSVEEVIAGELLWGATRGAINGTIVLVVVAVYDAVFHTGLIASPWALIIPVVAFFGALLFASLGMCFTAWSRTIDYFNFPIFLFITPMFLLSGTFFPLSILPGPLQVTALSVMPLTHLVNLIRSLMSGAVTSYLGLSPEVIWVLALVWIAVVTVLFFLLAIHLMKRKLIK
jgi:lipooligosaccharide transport system permease protein